MMYEKIENDLLELIASHFSIYEEFLNSDHWRIKKLEEMGLFNQEIINYLASTTNSTQNKIKKALEDIGIKTIDLPKLENYFEDGLLKINPIILKNNYTIQSIIKTAYNELSHRFIELSRKIEKSTREAYLSVVEEAYLKVSMGTHSYQEAIRESINNLSNKGIQTLVYKTTVNNGEIVGIRSYDIEAAVRREVLTNARRLSNDISMEISNELECDYIYLSEHLQCRPTHFDWQGTIIKRDDLIMITHYGEVDGLSGINCRHYFEPYFGDARDDELKEYSKEDCEKAYRLSQHQRYLERGLRKWKRKSNMFLACEDIESSKKCDNKVKEWRSRLDDFTKENNLRRDFTREFVSEKKEDLPYIDVTQKWLDNANPDSHEVEDRQYFEYENIKYKLDGKNVVLDYSKHEKEIAGWLENTFGGEIYMIPRINEPEGIKTPDFIFKNEHWDLKTINGNSKQALYHAIRKKSKQSNNFIFEILSEDLSFRNGKEQVQALYKRTDVPFVNKIILKKNDEFLVFKRK